MKYKVMLIALLMLASNISIADSSVTMKQMTRYQLSALDKDTTTLFLFKREGWGLTSCPQARLVSIDTSKPGFDIAYTTTMMAYSQKTKIVILADCDSSNADRAYLTHIVLDDS